MNSDESDKTKPIDTASGSRLRSESECSVTSDDGKQKEKRFCSSPQFMVHGLTNASPPKFVSLEEIMQAANGMRDMALVHQIVVDPNFKLAPVQNQDSMRSRVKDTMKQAFWDLLREQLAEEPPNYTQALVLLEDIKKGLFSVLLPQHTKIRQQIGEVLDSELIRQQAEAGVINFPHYAQYVVSVMSKLCAPVRDDKIKELMETTDVVETFKGILETLDLMILDMANFTIEVAKSDIIAHSVDWERKKFADYLSVVPDGLENTKKWLLRHFNINNDNYSSSPDRVTKVRNVTTHTLAEAYVELLEWDNNNQYPETLIIDEARLKDLQERINKIIVVGAIMLVTPTCIGGSLPGGLPFKDQLKEHLTVLMQSANEKNMNEVFINLADQVVKDVKECQQSNNLEPLKTETENILRNQIIDISKSDHRIRQLIHVRVREFLLQIITSPTAAPQQVPSGLSTFQKELAAIAGQFLRIVSHNRAVFSQYYLDIIDNALTTT